MLHVHLDGPAHIVGILLHQGLDLPDLQIAAVDLLLGILLDVHDHIGAHRLLLTGGDGVAVGAPALPLDALLLAVFFGDHRHLIGHHKGGVEAHAELADDGDVLSLGFLPVHLVLELEGTAPGDDAQVVLALLRGHADAVVPHGDGARFLVGDDLNFEVVPVQAHLVIGEGQVAQLVDGVRGVGDDLPQEDLFVGVNGIDHQVQQTLGLGLELFLCHGLHSDSLSVEMFS